MLPQIYIFGTSFLNSHNHIHIAIGLSPLIWPKTSKKNHYRTKHVSKIEHVVAEICMLKLVIPTITLNPTRSRSNLIRYIRPLDGPHL